MGIKLNALNPGEQLQGIATPGDPSLRTPEDHLIQDLT